MTELNGELWRDLYYASFDDLRLHVRHYPVAEAKARPVVCLSGLTRNGRDFHYLASYLSHHPQRPRADRAVLMAGPPLMPEIEMVPIDCRSRCSGAMSRPCESVRRRNHTRHPLDSKMKPA